MNAQQTRDVRIWAVEVILGATAAFNHSAHFFGHGILNPTVDEIVEQAKVLESYIRESTDLS